MEWINIEDKKPDDDQTVLVINVKIEMLATKAYYIQECEEFISLENGGGTTCPLSITHWMAIPEMPIY